MDILVVEDEWALRRTAVAALSSCGHQVTAAETGVEALACVETCRPDLVLLDLQLPLMDGREFLRHFRAQRECTDVPVVVMSAERNAARAELGIQAFLPKPFDLDELLETVDRLAPQPERTRQHTTSDTAGRTDQSP
jgi:CheY-like chemotaxis protein